MEKTLIELLKNADIEIIKRDKKYEIIIDAHNLNEDMVIDFIKSLSNKSKKVGPTIY